MSPTQEGRNTRGKRSPDQQGAASAGSIQSETQEAPPSKLTDTGHWLLAGVQVGEDNESRWTSSVDTLEALTRCASWENSLLWSWLMSSFRTLSWCCDLDSGRVTRFSHKQPDERVLVLLTEETCPRQGANEVTRDCSPRRWASLSGDQVLGRGRPPHRSHTHRRSKGYSEGLPGLCSSAVWSRTGLKNRARLRSARDV